MTTIVRPAEQAAPAIAATDACALCEPRYHVPLYPLFFIAAAGGAWAIIDKVRARR